jgi:hypothetical protein
MPARRAKAGSAAGGWVILVFAVLAWYRAAHDIIESTFGRKRFSVGAAAGQAGDASGSARAGPSAPRPWPIGAHRDLPARRPQAGMCGRPPPWGLLGPLLPLGACSRA